MPLLRRVPWLRVIDGTLTLRLGVDVLELVQAVLLGGRPAVGASRGLSGGKASYLLAHRVPPGAR